MANDEAKKKKGGGEITVTPRYPTPSDIRYVNIVKFSQLGSDVFMDVGTVDDLDLINVLAGKKEATGGISAEMPWRFGMSIDTLLKLQRQLADILKKMEK